MYMKKSKKKHICTWDGTTVWGTIPKGVKSILNKSNKVGKRKEKTND